MGQLLGPYYILYCSSLHPLLSPRPPFYILESHISLVPITLLRIMNFLCRLLAVTRVLKRGVKRGEKHAPGGLIYVRCQYKQNGKYNLAFSLCGDNGATQDSNKYLPWFIIRWRDTWSGAWVRGRKGKQVN